MKTMSLIKFGLGHVDSVETHTPVPGPTEVLVKVLAAVLTSGPIASTRPTIS